MKGIRKVFENCNLLNNERDISTHTGITRIHSLFIFQSFQLHPFTRNNISWANNTWWLFKFAIPYSLPLVMKTIDETQKKRAFPRFFIINFHKSSPAKDKCISLAKHFHPSTITTQKSLPIFPSKLSTRFLRYINVKRCFRKPRVATVTVEKHLNISKTRRREGWGVWNEARPFTKRIEPLIKPIGLLNDQVLRSFV